MVFCNGSWVLFGVIPLLFVLLWVMFVSFGLRDIIMDGLFMLNNYKYFIRCNETKTGIICILVTVYNYYLPLENISSEY